MSTTAIIWLIVGIVVVVAAAIAIARRASKRKA